MDKLTFLSFCRVIYPPGCHARGIFYALFALPLLTTDSLYGMLNDRDALFAPHI